ncbi:hypothetical protein ACIQOU_16775 [Streptomyces sp. NPDC091279]|uniref:hypothetical protein n=1 Tax=Streptomyces sp. NPDC091279 TaxID=3365983 RepID=UPI0037F850A5
MSRTVRPEDSHITTGPATTRDADADTFEDIVTRGDIHATTEPAALGLHATAEPPKLTEVAATEPDTEIKDIHATTDSFKPAH